MKEICGELLSVKQVIETIKVSGKDDCAKIIACCNTLDKAICALAKQEEDNAAD